MAEVLFAFAVNLAEFIHLPVQVEQGAVGIVERHGDQVGVEHLLILAGDRPDTPVLLDFVGDVLGCIDDVEGLAVFPLNDGIAVVMLPDRLFLSALVETEAHVEVADNAGGQLRIERVQSLGLFGRHACQELLGIHVALRQHVTVLVAEQVTMEVPLHHEVVTHVKHLAHHLSQV